MQSIPNRLVTLPWHWYMTTYSCNLATGINMNAWILNLKDMKDLIRCFMIKYFPSHSHGRHCVITQGRRVCGCLLYQVESKTNLSLVPEVFKSGPAGRWSGQNQKRVLTQAWITNKTWRQKILFNVCRINNCPETCLPWISMQWIVSNSVLPSYVLLLAMDLAWSRCLIFFKS